MQNNKITSIVLDLLLQIVDTFFNGVNILCTSSAQFISNYTDILSANQLEKVLFVLCIVFFLKMLLRSCSQIMFEFKHSMQKKIYSKQPKKIKGLGKRGIPLLQSFIAKTSNVAINKNNKHQKTN